MSLMSVQTLDDRLFLRVTKRDRERIEALAARLPIVGASAVARGALSLGLDILEKDPAKILTVKVNPEPPEPAPARRFPRSAGIVAGRKIR